MLLLSPACAAGRPALLAVPGDKPVLGRRVAGWRQNLHRTHGVTFRQRQRHYREECGVRNGEAGGGADRQILWSTNGIPMEYLWNSYGIPMEQHANNTPATCQRQAGYWLGGPGRPSFLVTL